MHKHQRKVEECYPTGLLTTPVQGKISALIYYINAKPEKLDKVSLYLIKKVPRDLKKESEYYNLATLEIISSILSNCQDYLLSFLPQTLEISLLFLQHTLPQDQPLLRRTIQLIKEICHYSKGYLPSIRSEQYFELFTQCLQLINNAIAPSSDPSLQKLVLEDFQATVNMEDFSTHFGSTRLQLILHSLLAHLPSAPLSSSSSASPSPTDLRQLADLILQKIIERCTSSTASMIIGIFFDEAELDNYSKSSKVALHELASRIPPQHLCVLISEIFSRLMDDSSSNLSKLPNLTNLLSQIIESNRSPLGYTAIEIVAHLIHILRKKVDFFEDSTLPRHSFTIPNPISNRGIYSINEVFLSLMKNSSFVLQKYEIIEYILRKSFFSSSAPPKKGTFLSSTFDDPHQLESISLTINEEGRFQKVIWGILFTILESNESNNIILRINLGNTPYRLFDLLLSLIGSGFEEQIVNCLFFAKLLFKEKNLFDISDRNNDLMKMCKSSIVHLLTKIRGALYEIFSQSAGEQYETNIIALTGSFSLLISCLQYCDYLQLSQSLKVALFMYERSDAMNKSDTNLLNLLKYIQEAVNIWKLANLKEWLTSITVEMGLDQGNNALLPSPEELIEGSFNYNNIRRLSGPISLSEVLEKYISDVKSLAGDTVNLDLLNDQPYSPEADLQCDQQYQGAEGAGSRISIIPSEKLLTIPSFPRRQDAPLSPKSSSLTAPPFSIRSLELDRNLRVAASDNLSEVYASSNRNTSKEDIVLCKQFSELSTLEMARRRKEKTRSFLGNQ